jgi:hypothetical protein
MCDDGSHHAWSNVVECLDENRCSRFVDWFNGLDAGRYPGELSFEPADNAGFLLDALVEVERKFPSPLVENCPARGTDS